MTPEARAIAAYRAMWNSEPLLVARAPGRVNLIGEHTDYNDGFVMPCAIGFETAVAAGPGEAASIESIAADYASQTDVFSLDTPIEAVGEWRDYVRGVAQVLHRDGELVPTRLAIAGDVPLGAGLSSSAAIEVAVAKALLGVAGRELAGPAIARAAQRAENEFVGCACGIMDQLVSVLGQADHALLIDCRSLEGTPISLPSDATVMIINSGVRHTHAGGEYNARRQQCEAAARHYGVAALRDLDIDTLERGRAGLDRVAYARARHVVTENARTLEAAAALTAGDLRALGPLMAASHVSMRDDFEITVPAIDRLVEIVDLVLDGNGGARMTGGGFGGCVVAVMPAALAEEAEAAVRRDYRTPDGGQPDIYRCTATQGASTRRL